MSLNERLNEALENALESPDEAIQILAQIVKDESLDDESLKIRDSAAMELGKLFFQQKRAIDLGELVKLVRGSIISHLSKAKATKLIRGLLDLYLDLQAGDGREVQMDLCMDCIEWAKTVNRNYLRQALEARLVALYFENNRFQDALRLAASLQRELKQVDDKALQAELHLIESKTFYALGNVQKSRGSLTAARTATSGIYTPPRLQADFDMQSGIIHATDDRDFKTAYSYFYEAFEGFDKLSLETRATTALKYMLLCKIVLNQADEVQQLLSGKIALKYSGADVDAMRHIAAAYTRRSLSDFREVQQKYRAQLEQDGVVNEHLKTVYSQLVEQNLLRVLEPFSRVELQHVATLVGLHPSEVQRTVSRMILDKKLHGVIEQAAGGGGADAGVLILYEASERTATLQSSLDLVEALNKVVDSLYSKAKKLTA